MYLPLQPQARIRLSPAEAEANVQLLGHMLARPRCPKWIPMKAVHGKAQTKSPARKVSPIPSMDVRSQAFTLFEGT
jgi:hypothetical protein